MSDAYFSSMDVQTRIVDNTIASVEDTLSLSLFPVLVPGFSSKGIYNKATRFNNPTTVLSTFGDDFEDVEKYGLQNLNLLQQLRGGGTGFFVRLVHEESAKQSNRMFKLKLKINDQIQLYERDGYGEFKIDPETQQKIKLEYEKLNDEGEPDGGTTKTEVKVPGLEVSIISEYVESGQPVWTVEDKSDDGDYRLIPLFFVKSNTKGSCGNNFALKITNDFTRDDMVEDGRRYTLNTYELKSTGYDSQNKAYHFSFNPEAVQSEGSTVSESLGYVYTNLDNYGRPTDILLEYASKNYASIKEYVEKAIVKYNEFKATAETEDSALNEVLNTRTSYILYDVNDFDMINKKTKTALAFDNVVSPEDLSLTVNFSTPVPMVGGDDGWLGALLTKVTNPFVGNSPTRGTTEGDAVTLTKEDLLKDDWKYGVLTEDFQSTVKEQLLMNFYNCDIPGLRAEILSIYKCPASYIADAAFSSNVKKSMIEFARLRADMGVIFDVGLNCTNLDMAIAEANVIRSWISTSDDPQRMAIIPFAGTAVNTSKKIRTTATYEFCYDIAKVYSITPFAIIAGYQNQFGAIRTMIMDFVVEEDKPRGSQFKKAKDAMIIYPVDLGEAASSIADDNVTGKKYYWMSNRSLYPTKISKLSELRNGFILADLRKIASIVLARYTFNSDTAETSMAKAKKDLDKQIFNRYPKDLSIVTAFEQTDYDKLINSCSVYIYVTFPNIIETYKVTISAERAE